MKRTLFIVVCSLLFSVHGQDDSYVTTRKTMLKSNIHDTTRARVYAELADYIVDEKIWVDFNDLAYDLANKHLQDKNEAYRKFYLKVKADAVGNRGYYFDDHGDKVKALDYYFESLKLYDQAGAELGKASILSNIGVIFTNQGDYKEALDYLEQSLAIKRKHNSLDLAKSHLNIGVVYEKQGKGTDALREYHLALKNGKETNDFNDIATALNNIGSHYYKKAQYDTSIYYLKQAVVNFNLDGDDSGIAWSMANIGNSYYYKNEIDSAYKYCVRANEIAEHLGLPELTQSVAEKLALLYSYKEDWKNALKYERLAYKMQDSLQNVEVQKRALEQKLNYDHELVLEKQKLEREKDRLKRAEERRTEKQRYFFGGLLLVILLIAAGLVYQRLRITRKQKTIIEEQKKTVETKNDEILASIAYARRLQSAIIPSDEEFKRLFNDSYVIYKPKDIVAGDFYWTYETTEFKYVLVGDCTGHGVPGAIVSVVCANALDSIVKEAGVIDTNEILDRVSEMVKLRFASEEVNVKDGMDAVLCRIDKTKQSVQFSGAMNPLWILREGSEEIDVIKGDRQPIGAFDYAKDFSRHVVQLNSGDTLYLASDGFSDQFGGSENRKFGSANLKRLLIDKSGLNLDEQKLEIEATFNSWKGDEEQIDDVTLVTIRF